MKSLMCNWLSVPCAIHIESKCKCTRTKTCSFPNTTICWNAQLSHHRHSVNKVRVFRCIMTKTCYIKAGPFLQTTIYCFVTRKEPSSLFLQIRANAWIVVGNHSIIASIPTICQYFFIWQQKIFCLSFKNCEVVSLACLERADYADNIAVFNWDPDFISPPSSIQLVAVQRWIKRLMVVLTMKIHTVQGDINTLIVRRYPIIPKNLQKAKYNLVWRQKSSYVIDRI